jgi:replication factor A1
LLFLYQILNIKAVLTAGAANNAPTRYRILLMDGADYISAMSATQLNEQITNKSIIDFSVVKLTNYMIQDVAGQK